MLRCARMAYLTGPPVRWRRRGSWRRRRTSGMRWQCGWACWRRDWTKRGWSAARWAPHCHGCLISFDRLVACWEAKLDGTRVERGRVGHQCTCGHAMPSCSGRGALPPTLHLPAAGTGAVRASCLISAAHARAPADSLVNFLRPCPTHHSTQAESYRALAAQSEEKRARAEDELLTTARLVRGGGGVAAGSCCGGGLCLLPASRSRGEP